MKNPSKYNPLKRFSGPIIALLGQGCRDSSFTPYGCFAQNDMAENQYALAYFVFLARWLQPRADMWVIVSSYVGEGAKSPPMSGGLRGVDLALA